jgi:hypothetical protein
MANTTLSTITLINNVRIEILNGGLYDLQGMASQAGRFSNLISFCVESTGSGHVGRYGERFLAQHTTTG